jgi:homopolymeric O-antigen transport system ATP-binding protein
MNDLMIKVENLGKQYKIGHSKGPRYRTFRDIITEAATKPFKKIAGLMKGEAYSAAGLTETMWALRGASFNVRKGEVVGIIGRNGAGKSTLLKLLSRITEPTEGQAELKGRVGSLLEVGTGFHPELTGRENIFLSGAVLGMRKEEIRQKFDEIVEFAEISKFLETPIKFYSSGMYVRLAFSIAAHLEPEILLVDEVLAVGDVAFQKKCLGKMSDVTKHGRTILFVSHNMGAIRSLCDRAILIEGGRIALDGDVDHVVANYLDSNLLDKPIAKEPDFKDKVEETGNYEGKKGVLTIDQVSITNESGDLENNFHSDEKIRIRVRYTANTRINNMSVIVHVVDDENREIISSINLDDKKESERVWIDPGTYDSVCEISADLLGERTFFISVQLRQLKFYRVTLDKILKFHVLFKGYNNIQEHSFKGAFLRPQFAWKTERLRDQ